MSLELYIAYLLGCILTTYPQPSGDADHCEQLTEGTRRAAQCRWNGARRALRSNHLGTTYPARLATHGLF